MRSNTECAGNNPDAGRFGALLIFALAALLYVFNLGQTYVGFYNDDADYILGALSLLHGHYALLRLPWQPLINLRWPGFPIFLVPFVAVLKPHWICLKGVPLIVTLACDVLVWRWAQRRLTTDAAMAIAALFAFHPLTLECSQAVMSEPLFLFLVLTALLLIRPIASVADWGVGGVAACALLVRPEGTLLVLALTVVFARCGGWRRAGKALVPSLLAITAFGIARSLAGAPSPGYWNEWLRNLKFMSGSALIHNLASEMLALLAGAALQWPFPQSRLLFGLGVIFSLALSALLIWGCREAWKEKPARPETAVVILFLAAYLALHSLWLAVNLRYLWLLLPFLFFAWAKIPFKRFFRVGASVLLATYLWNDGSHLRAAHQPSASSAPPLSILEWIDKNLGPHDLILTNDPSMVYLYTGRSAVGLQEDLFQGPAGFLERCLSEGITVVAYLPLPPEHGNLPATEDIIRQWKSSRLWAATRSFAFEPAEQSPDGSIAVYRVRPLPAYVQAYGFYVSALHDVVNGRPDWAAAKLQEALHEEPEFPEALDAYGVSLLLSKGDKHLARMSFKKAFDLAPDFAQAQRHLDEALSSEMR